MKRLKEAIENRCRDLKVEPIDSDYKEFIEIYKEFLYGKYEKADQAFYPVFVLLIIITKIGPSYAKKLGELIKSCSLIFSSIILSEREYSEYYDALKIIYNHDHDKKVSEKELLAAQNTVRKMNKEFDEIYDNVPKRKMRASVALKELFYLYPDKNVFMSVLAFDKLAYIDNNFDRVLDDIKHERSIQVKNKDLKKLKRESINTMGNREIKIIDKYCKIIDDYYINLHNEIRNNSKTNNKIKTNYQKLYTKLFYTKGYISSINEDIKLIEDENVLHEYLRYVISNNSKHEEEVSKKNIELKSKQVSNIEIIFNKYGYNLSKLSDDKIMQIREIDNLEEKLNLLSNSKLNIIKEDNPLFIVLLNCDIDQIYYFTYLYKRNIIDIMFLTNNRYVITNKDVYNNFKLNISMFDNIINKIVKYNKNILLIDNNLLIKRIKLMQEYYNIDINKFNKFEFLENDNIFNLLDNFIELGYYNQIYNNPDYLVSSNLNVIKRLQIARLINMNVINNDNSFIGSVITGDNFYIPDSKLDEFIVDYTEDYVDNGICNINISDSDYCYLSKLSDYEIDDLTYSINGKLISKNRLLRNINVLKEHEREYLLHKAILSGSINLDNDDISLLNSIIGIKIKVKK